MNPHWKGADRMKLLTNSRRIPEILMIPVLGLALYLRLYFLRNGQLEPLEWDQLNYTKMALQWLETGIYAYRDTLPNTLVTPGFPAFLAMMLRIFGYEQPEATLMLVREVQCFIGLVAIWVIFRTGSRLFTPGAGLLAALFAAVYPSYVWSSSLILTEVIFLSSFSVLLFLQVRIIQENRRTDHILAGAMLAVTVLIRPNVLPLGVVPYLFLWIKSRRMPWAMILRGAISFSILMLPWWVRNWITFHEFIPIAKGEAGNPFLGGTDPYFRGTINWEAVGEKGQFQEGLRRIREGLIQDPLLWIGWFTVGKFRVFFRTLWVGSYPFSVPEWYFYLLNKLHFVLVYIGLAVLPVMALRGRLAYGYLLAGLAVFWGVHQVFIPVDRYLYGMLPFLMMGVAGAAAELMAAMAVRGKLLWPSLKRTAQD
jgi:4-amino-4-deoxy-L-arabinose transferase-like glycosyltransferase